MKHTYDSILVILISDEYRFVKAECALKSIRKTCSCLLALCSFTIFKEKQIQFVTLR